MARHGTRVFLYFNEAESLVGFSALGLTRWPHYPTAIAILVQIAIQREFQGKPDGTNEQKYSRQIMGDVIMRAHALDCDWLVLTVDPRNLAAINLYRSYQFEVFNGQTPRGHAKMQLRLK